MTTDVTDRDVDDDIDRRLRAAMSEIAAAYRPGVEPPSRSPRRGRLVVGAAASALAVLGATGIWALNRGADKPAATETTEVVPPGPPWLANLTVPDIPAPAWAVHLDPSLGIDDFPRNSELFNWVTSREPLASRWFVESDDGVATSYIAVSDLPMWAWGERESADEYELDGYEAQRGNEGDIRWRLDDGVRSVASIGLDDAFVDEFVQEVAGIENLDAVALPRGFEEITYQPMVSWQWADDWSAGVFEPSADTMDLALSTWTLAASDARAIPGGWLMDSDDAEQGWLAVFEVDGKAVQLSAPTSVDEATMRNIADLITIVPAADVAERRYPDEDGTPVGGGELSSGRWLALLSRDAADDAGSCLSIIGAIEVDGCDDSDADSDITLCGRIAPRMWMDRGDTGRWAAVTTRVIGPDDPIDVTVAEEPTDAYELERSGGLTFIIGETRGGAVSNLSVTMPDGSELCPR